MVITAPPTVSEQSRDFQREQWLKNDPPGTEPGLLRTVTHSKSYVDATRDFAASRKAKNVYLVDAYSAVMREAQQSGKSLWNLFL